MINLCIEINKVYIWKCWWWFEQLFIEYDWLAILGLYVVVEQLPAVLYVSIILFSVVAFCVWHFNAIKFTTLILPIPLPLLLQLFLIISIKLIPYYNQTIPYLWWGFQKLLLLVWLLLFVKRWFIFLNILVPLFRLFDKLPRCLTLA